MAEKKSGKARRRPAVQVELPLPGPMGSPVESLSSDDPPPQLRPWQQPVAVATIALLGAIGLALAVAGQISAYRDREKAARLENRVRQMALRAPTQERALRVTPNPRSWSATPDATIRWPEPPELLELYIPVGYTDYPSFAVTIDKVDQGRVLNLYRVMRDSNRELRFALNTSAFGPGEYRMKLQGYNWRGDRSDVGWIRLIVQAPK
jgi:hypothetical protein